MMDVEFQIRIKTLEDLERVLIFESMLPLLKIFPVTCYFQDEKIRIIHLFGKELFISSFNKTISFEIEKTTERYQSLMYIENLLLKNGIKFSTCYDDISRTRKWFLDDVEGPMKVTFKGSIT